MEIYSIKSQVDFFRNEIIFDDEKRLNFQHVKVIFDIFSICTVHRFFVDYLMKFFSSMLLHIHYEDEHQKIIKKYAES